MCSIGKNISTKGPDGDQRLDVTDRYKFPEGMSSTIMLCLRCLDIQQWLTVAVGNVCAYVLHLTANLYKSHDTEMKLVIYYQFLCVENEYDIEIAQ